MTPAARAIVEFLSEQIAKDEHRFDPQPPEEQNASDARRGPVRPVLHRQPAPNVD